MRHLFRTLLLLSSVLLPGLLAAHHSRAYFGNELVTVTGKLVDVKWQNPHVALTVEVPRDDGTSESWKVEGNSIYDLMRRGVDQSTFTPGTEVTVTGRLSKREPRAALMTSLELADGRRFAFERTDAPAGQADKVVDAAAENRGLFRVWSMPAADRAAIQGQIGELPLTAAAKAAKAAWNPRDSFALRCEPEGMPRIMINPHPFEFVDAGDRIILRTELYDTERVIYMSDAAPPADAAASRLGYSVGRWEDGVLVVHTTRVDWPYFDNAGTPQSGDVAIDERYVLSDDQSRVDFALTITDPATFTAPVHLGGYWLALGESILKYDCHP